MQYGIKYRRYILFSYTLELKMGKSTLMSHSVTAQGSRGWGGFERIWEMEVP